MSRGSSYFLSLPSVKCADIYHAYCWGINWKKLRISIGINTRITVACLLHKLPFEVNYGD
uniref:Uncharacterized protein n=1 Tax=Oryza punctata TaxID=4537 RepID=A0A0E0K235_ORYPU